MKRMRKIKQSKKIRGRLRKKKEVLINVKRKGNNIQRE